MARDLCTATAAVKLMLNYPFWCELYYSMEVVEDANIPTLCTNGKKMWVNPEFWGTLSLDLKISALVHETLHKMLHHCTRGLDFEEPWGNIACDIIVNQMLVDNGFKIAPSWVQPEPKYVGWTFENVYHDLMANRPKPPPQPQGGGGQGQPKPGQGGGKAQAGQPDTQQGQPGQGQPGQGKPQPGQGQGVPAKYAGAWSDVQKFKGTPAQREAFEEKVEEQVQQALDTAKAMGCAPVGMQMAMKAIFKVAEEKWFDHLRRFFHGMRRREFDWGQVNRRMAMAHRVVAPVQQSPSLGPVVTFIDASGSCFTTAQQADFGGHVNSILSEAMPERLFVAYFEMDVTEHYEVDPGEMEFEARPRGGGGTSFVHLFDWVSEQGIQPSVVIVLTDMYGTFPQDAPDYPVIWASTSPGEKAPFGEVIEIK